MLLLIKISKPKSKNFFANSKPIPEEDPDNKSVEAIEEENDEYNISLAALEIELKPKILKTFEKLSKNYKKLISYQKEKLETVLARSKFSPSKEKNYQLIKEEISQDILQLQLNPATQEELVQLNYVENKKLINFDGELLRLSSKHGIPREEFIKFYVGNEINPNFESFLGENKKWHNFFTKEKKEKSGKKKEKKSNMGKRITIDEADLFKENFKFPSSSSISVFANRESLISFETKKTNPNVIVIGADENYLLLNGFELAGGRNINLIDIQSARYVCLLGNDVASKLFGGKPDKAVNEIVRVQNIPYRVIGILASRGSSFGMSFDNRVITSYKNVDRQFNPGSSYVVAVKTDDILQMDQASGEAEGLFRAVRKLITTEENNFVVDRNDSMVEKAMNSIGFITISATVIGLITLIGAAIGLMNIMLVAVTERTKEVGLIKAIGGKSKIVRYQFLLESTIISVMGALFGIVFGILFGNGVSLLIDTGFVVPWNWVISPNSIVSPFNLGHLHHQNIQEIVRVCRVFLD